MTMDFKIFRIGTKRFYSMRRAYILGFNAFNDEFNKLPENVRENINGKELVFLSNPNELFWCRLALTRCDIDHFSNLLSHTVRIDFRLSLIDHLELVTVIRDLFHTFQGKENRMGSIVHLAYSSVESIVEAV